MVSEKQWGNTVSGKTASDHGEKAAREAAAKENFNRLFGGGGAKQSAPTPVPPAGFKALFRGEVDLPNANRELHGEVVTWTPEEVKELKMVAERLREYRGMYSDRFKALEKGFEVNGPVMKRLLDASGRAQHVLAGVKTIAHQRGVPFDFTAKPFETGRDEISMDATSYAFMKVVLAEKQAAIASGAHR